MKKIIVLQGPPASGKSTWARDTAKAGTPYVIVNRDSIREARGEYWIPEQESYISDLEEFGVRSAVNRGLIPIIDATNLNPKTIQKWNDLAKELNCEIEFKPFYVPYKEALERDKGRSRPVGEKVLKRFYTQYFHNELVKELGYPAFDLKVKEHDDNKTDCVIFDIDGTLAHHCGRLPFEWEKLGTDLADSRVVRIIRKFNLLAIKIIFLTGRPESVRKETEKWIRENIPGINFSLIMRDSKDFRSGEIVKKELWEQCVEPKYNTLSVYEDSNKCADMWRDLGLLTCQVYKNNY